MRILPTLLAVLTCGCPKPVPLDAVPADALHRVPERVAVNLAGFKQSDVQLKGWVPALQDSHGGSRRDSFGWRSSSRYTLTEHRGEATLEITWDTWAHAAHRPSDRPVEARWGFNVPELDAHQGPVHVVVKSIEGQTLAERTVQEYSGLIGGRLFGPECFTQGCGSLGGCWLPGG